MTAFTRPLPIALAAALVAGAAALGGCQKQPEKDAVHMPDVKPGIVVSGARIVLPAVPGRPAALYFTVANTGTALSRIVRIEVDGASKVEMHETVGNEMKPLDLVRIEPTQVVNFEAGGKHAMVFGLDPQVTAGQEIGVTLHFFDTRVYNITAKTIAPGQDGTISSTSHPGDGGMAGMNMAPASGAEHRH